MVTLIKNPHGRVVSVTPERKEFLLNPTPMHIDPQNGKRIKLIKQEHEQGWMEPTPAEVAVWEEENKPKPKANEPQSGAVASTPTSAVPTPAATASAKTSRKAAKMSPELEAKLRDAENDKVKYDALTVEEQANYLALFGDSPSA